MYSLKIIILNWWMAINVENELMSLSKHRTIQIMCQILKK